MWFFMAIAYEKLGNNNKALECYSKAVELDPKHAVAWNNLGLVYYNLGNIDKAIECTRKASALDPSAETYRNNLEFYQEKKRAA